MALVSYIFSKDIAWSKPFIYDYTSNECTLHPKRIQEEFVIQLNKTLSLKIDNRYCDLYEQ